MGWSGKSQTTELYFESGKLVELSSKIRNTGKDWHKEVISFCSSVLALFSTAPLYLKRSLNSPEVFCLPHSSFFFVCVAISYRKLLFILPHSTYCCPGKNCISKIFVFIPVLTVFPLWALQQKRVAEITPDVLVIQHQSLTCPSLNRWELAADRLVPWEGPYNSL